MVSKFFLEEVSKINYRIKYWLHGALLPLLEIKKGIWNGYIQMPFVPFRLEEFLMSLLKIIHQLHFLS